MAKRFFAGRPELFVEIPSNNNNGVSRRALTSDEYPSLCYGNKDQFTPKYDWEIVIVRPNIEHNMLAAVLGRGGSEELGSTFWGQTELSCYDDSMHGVWGMSYKYHEVGLSYVLKTCD
jgi:hypothetical protein